MKTKIVSLLTAAVLAIGSFSNVYAATENISAIHSYADKERLYLSI